MRITQLRQADLNLLVVFTVLAEERNVSAAANRLSLSQPAVTRALQRLRDMFRDDLLVRLSGSYELTPKGQRLLQELETMLPRLDRLLAGGAFDPGKEEAHFRVAGTDYANLVIGPQLCKQFLAAGKGVSFTLSPLNDEVFDAMQRGRIDLLLHADDGQVPLHYLRETIFEEEFVCVVAREFPCSQQMSLPQYLKSEHVGVTIFGGKQTIPEQRLSTAGLNRHCPFTVPYFSIASRCVAGTPLVATVPKRLASYESRNPNLKILKAPKIMGSFKYLMIWHPRVDGDAAHVWLRSTVKAAGEKIAR